MDSVSEMVDCKGFFLLLPVVAVVVDFDKIEHMLRLCAGLPTREIKVY